MPKRITKGPSFSTLESMAGANVWHRIARNLFVQQILDEDHKGEDTFFDLVENKENAEVLLHDGQQIAENDNQNQKVGGFRLIALNLYKEFKKRVDEIGEGDVSVYAKKVTGKKERHEFEEWQEIDNSRRRRGGKEI